MSGFDTDVLLKRLEEFPLAASCFRDYVLWLAPRAGADGSQYDVIQMLETADTPRLEKLESRLTESKSILNINENEFVRIFGFDNDLLSTDPEKVHDILAEPLLVLDLDHFGFREIKKLPTFYGTPKNKIRNADFTARYRNCTVAIELKTIRMENNPPPVPGKLLGNALKPDWWGDMFRRNAITKIEDKERRALVQIATAQINYNCDKGMLVLYSRRLGPSTLMSRSDYIEELQALLVRYPAIDFMAVKNYFAETVLVQRQ